MSGLLARGLPVVALCACQIAIAHAQAPMSASRLSDLLDRYARGEHDVFLPLHTPADLQHVGDALLRDAEAWVRRGGAQGLRRRQLLAATAALEIARASLAVDWHQGRRLLEWGASLLGKHDPDEAERLWHLAAVSLMQGASDNELLMRQRDTAWRRFEADPRLLLAIVVTLEGETWPDPDRSQPWDIDEAALMEAAPTTAEAYEYRRRERMRSAIAFLEQLTVDEAIRAEVLLRLGFLHLRLHHSEIALEQFEELAALTEDRFLLYLAQLFTGFAYEQDGNLTAAAPAYRAALDILPRAQSASVALASLLFLRDEAEEAARIIDAAVKAPLADDPWRTYQTGDFRLWAERLSALKKALP